MFSLRLSLILATIIFSTAAVSLAASPYKEGDEVEVFMLNEWRPGKVVAVNARGQVLVEYVFVKAQREVFDPRAVRFVYEANALAPSRTYSDASGSFKIKAALIRVTADTATLRKPDMKEIDVPLAKLSPGDQAFLRSIAKKLGDAATSGATPIRWVEPPPAETFATGTNSFGSLSSATSKPIALDPDVAPSYLKMKQGGVGFPNQDFFDKMGAVLPLGGSDGWILGVVANDGHGDKQKGTRLLWVSLAKQKIAQQQLLPPGAMVLDYHPGHKLLLTQHGSGKAWDKEDPTLTLWSASPVDKDLKPIVRWRVESKWFDDPWARIINEKIVLQRTGKQNYIGWNVETKRQDFKVAQESFFGAFPILSAGRRYFILPEDERVRVLDASNGQTLSTLPVKDRASAVAMTEDGLRLAVLERYSLRIWNFDNLEGTEERYPADSIGTPFSTKLAWVGPDRLMTDNGHGSLVLYSLKRRMSIWHYELDHESRPEHGATRSHEIVAGHLVYAASVRNGGESGLAVGAVELPGPKVNETDAAIDPDSLLILKPGSVVKLEVNCGEYTAQVQEALDAEIKKNGWTTNDAATAVITATMSQAEQQTITYRTGGFGQPVSEQTVTVTPFVSSLVLKMADKEIWSSGTRTGAPGIISAKEGQSLQEEVDRWQKPNPGFFATVDIPDKIMDPAKRNGLGTTKVTNRGLIPK